MQGLIFSDKCVNRKISLITNHSRAGSMCFTLETDTIAIKKEKNRNSRNFCEQKIYLQNWLINILSYYFVHSFIAFFRISLLFKDFAYKLLKCMVIIQV